MTKVKETKDIKGAMTQFFSKLSRGLMLPIALLPIAGLFLGVGAGIVNVIKVANPDAGYWATFVPQTFSSIGDVVFGNLPTLFCLGVAVAFSEEAGVAVFSALVGWIVFNATQSTMIWDYGHAQYWDSAAQQWTNFGAADWMMNINLNDVSAANGNAATQFATESYSIFWFVNGIVPTSVVGTNVGLTSMQTSVFGGITIGLFVAFLYNKFHTIELPTIIGFFSGSRFVPIITFLTVPLWGIAFLAFWPIFGILLDKFGQAMNSMPIGLNSFIFGAVERSLIPFGLHHAFYSPLWYTSAGGQLLATSNTHLISGFENVTAAGTQLAGGDQNVWFEMQTLGIPYSTLNHYITEADFKALTDNSGWYAVTGIKDSAVIGSASGNVVLYHDGVDVAQITNGMQPGAYMQGKYSFMILGLPAAGAAMIMAAKKENREVAMSVIGAAALTSFLTGITEPIEFTFLFLAPILYYGFHIWMAAISFWFANIIGMHMGMTFSGGAFDFILFGIVPDATGLGAHCWWALVLGVIYMPIYYFVFYFYITKFDVKTPGRDDGEVVMITKSDYKAAKGGKKDEAWEARANELLEHLGGLENLTKINACITRLRLDVVNPEAVNYEAIKKMGSKGCVGEGTVSQQHIFGPEADKFKNYFLKLKKK